MSVITPGDLIAATAISGAACGTVGGTIGFLASKTVRDIVWHRYAVTVTAAFRPAARRHDPSAKAVTVSAQKTRPGPEPAALAAVPDADSVTRREAAALLGVGERNVRDHEQEWGLVALPYNGRGTRYTAESVRRLLQARNEAA